MSRIACTHRLLIIVAIELVVILAPSYPIAAKSPGMIAEGRMLFERNWAPRNPTIGSDGLGPLFNGQSCVVCHRQGGVGGAGEAEFNAKTVGIERMQVSGGVINDEVVAQAVSTFHPGFVDPSGKVVNTFALAHHGGSGAFAASRAALMKKLPVEFSAHGGPVSAAEVRRANATPILHFARLGKNKIAIRARLYQRNTTPLFGSGLIDLVSDKQLKAIERQQKQHAEISGRLSTLPDARIGKFGWRGNVASLLEFCDQACAGEVGLETKRKPQPMDPTMRNYRNPSVDISDQAIRSMALFVAALPAPVREIPSDSELRMEVLRGEQLFASVGCAVCHVPSLGPAQGLYSDLLLHDMGYESIDLNPANPYIVRLTPATQYDRQVTTTKQTSVKFDDTVSTTYYGNTTSMSGSNSGSTSSSGTGPRDVRRPGAGTMRSRRGYDFVVPMRPATTIRFVSLGSKTKQFSFSDVERDSYTAEVGKNEKTASGRDSYQVDTTRSKDTTVTETRTDYLRIHIESTNFTQEWRTPPLWGVRDSAPYMHDGRAETLLESIAMHEGESKGTRDRFLQLSLADRNAIIAFLNTMVAPPNAPQPDDASVARAQ
jgi:CxxC motif-containing protein (DUF1111 family)